MEHIENYPLERITTFHLPAQCRHFINYSSVEELREILKSNLFRSMPSLHIGEGSNLLFTKNYDGIILHSRIEYIDVIEDNDDTVILKAGAGLNWDKFVKYCVGNGYYGIENMSYIPGEIGASAIQNIGSYGIEVKDVIHKVHCIAVADGSERVFLNEECRYGYRDSIFKNELKDKYIVVAVEYKLSKVPVYSLEYGPLKNMLDDGGEITLQRVRQTIIDVRKSKLPDPADLGSAGSFFKNPVISKERFNALKHKYPSMPGYILSDTSVKVPAGWLIENAGLKGFSAGGARVYEKQCLVIVNGGNATSGDVVELYTAIIDKVKDLYDIQLHPEANII